MYTSIKAKAVSVTNLQMFDGDFEKAYKYEQMSHEFTGIEKEHYDNVIKLNQCIEAGYDIPDDCVSTLDRCLKHFKENKEQYIVLGSMTLALLSASLMIIPGAMPTSSVTVACASGMPSVNMNTVTSMLTKLTSNLIKIGSLLVGASCVIDMIKSIIQGNISHLPKSLITHGLMVCSLFLSPMVFSAISTAFGV